MNRKEERQHIAKEEVVNIRFHSNGTLWTESEEGGNSLLQLARKVTGIANLSYDKVLDGVYCGNISEYYIENISLANYDFNSKKVINVLVETNLFSKLEVMEIVESLRHSKEETGELEMISFEWDVNDVLLLKKWRKAGYPLNWGMCG